MAEPTEKQGKFRIESLSDLIFGLALSIGALTLIGTAPSSFGNLLYSLLYYAFSFLILISVWRNYTTTMSYLHIETSRDLNLNVFLLFLVSIEPFLFNELNISLNLTQNVSILYALDLGGLFSILAFLGSSILKDRNRPVEVLRSYELRRNSQIIAATFFFVSILPFFWTLGIPINNQSRVPLRLILWIVPLFLHPIRVFIEKKTQK